MREFGDYLVENVCDKYPRIKIRERREEEILSKINQRAFWMIFILLVSSVKLKLWLHMKANIECV